MIITSLDDIVINKFYNAAIKSIPAAHHKLFKDGYFSWVKSIGDLEKSRLANDLRTLKKDAGAILARDMLEMFKIREEEKLLEQEILEAQNGSLGDTINDSISDGSSNPTLSGMGASGSKSSNSDTIGSSSPTM